MQQQVPYHLDVNINKVQILAIVFSFVLLGFIVGLIRKKHIKEEYSVLWLGVSFVFILFSLWREGLDYVSAAIGVAYPPAALFMLLLVASFLILIQFSVIISRQSENTKNLAQEHALLKLEYEELKKEIQEVKHEVKEQKNEPFFEHEYSE